MTETAAVIEETTNDGAGLDDGMVLIPKSMLGVMLACTAMIGDVLPRAWSGLEVSNHDLMARAAADGLIIERMPTAEEVLDGIEPGTAMLSFSPELVDVLAGLASSPDADDESEDGENADEAEPAEASA